ncbi:ATP-binding protein [Sulfurimonas sp.]
MKTEKVLPNVSNFIKSIRDVGYTFEVAVADIIDNSISAKATFVKILAISQPELQIGILDNGYGMNEEELVEAMRLASKNPDMQRAKNELGKFGLGLKTASFSQCKKLTVISKKDTIVSIKQWDLDYIEEKDDWLLITPDMDDYQKNTFYQELKQLENGTLVIWENIDRYKKDRFSSKIDTLTDHLSLVFHRFLEKSFTPVSLYVNNSKLKPFNPFNPENMATFEKKTEIIRFANHKIEITPYILPHHKKVSKQEWDYYATNDGYTKTQGFYLYRENRLLIYGTWWGLLKPSDATKLVRIKIDITNEQDKLWGIDVKKSTANPIPELKQDLKRILTESIKDGIKPYSKRAKKIQDKTEIKFWDLVINNGKIYFKINKEHPIYIKIKENMTNRTSSIFDIYLKGLEHYMPLEAIEYHLQQSSHDVSQKELLTNEDIDKLIKQLQDVGMNKNDIEKLLKTEIFKDRQELVDAKLLSKN